MKNSTHTRSKKPSSPAEPQAPAIEELADNVTGVELDLAAHRAQVEDVESRVARLEDALRRVARAVRSLRRERRRG